MSTPAVELEQVTLAFGRRDVLCGVDLRIERGEVVGLLGPNGVGKSTTQALIAGWYPPTRGTVKVFGALAGSPAAAGKIGAMGPSCPLEATRTIRAELVRHTQLLGLDPEIEIERWLDCLQLRPLLSRRAGDVSEGERRRAELACALLGDPPLLLLDEPMAGLDPSQVRAVQGLISGRPEGQTVILSSNRLEAINPLCDRVVVIVGGEVAVDNSPSSENDAAGLYFSAVGSLDDEQRSVGEKT